MTAIELWPAGPPGTESWTHERVEYLDTEGEPRVRNVAAPTVTPFLPDPHVATGTGVIVAPGGGFDVLAIEHEGLDVCRWLAAHGVAAFLLEYRLRDTGGTPEDFARLLADQQTERTAGKDLDAIMRRGLTVEQVLGMMPSDRVHALEDGAQAVRVVRARAAEWGIAPDRLGFLGFSAGAFVAASVAQHDDELARPDFVAPIYGGHVKGPVSPDAPPMFSVVTADDWGLLDACLTMFRAWRDAGHTPELHVYAQGGHGFGMKKLGLPVDQWPERFMDWLSSIGLHR